MKLILAGSGFTPHNLYALIIWIYYHISFRIKKCLHDLLIFVWDLTTTCVRGRRRKTLWWYRTLYKMKGGRCLVPDNYFLSKKLPLLLLISIYNFFIYMFYPVLGLSKFTDRLSSWLWVQITKLRNYAIILAGLLENF